MNLKPFVAWCVSNGIQTPLEIRQRTQNGIASRYTVFANERQEEVAIDKAKEKIKERPPFTTILQCPLRNCIIESSMEKLAHRLVMEKAMGDQSFYAPFIATLPLREEQLPDLPRFWSMERLEGVTDEGFLYDAVQEETEELQQQQEQQQQQHKSMVVDVNSDGNDTELLLWARAVVDSRAHFLPGGCFALTPVFDMINHDANIQTKAAIIDQPPEGPAFCLSIALRGKKTRKAERRRLSLGKKADSEAEEEVCISYGDHLTNLQTLLKYGFVQKFNPNNIEFVRLLVMGLRESLIIQIHDDGKVASPSTSLSTLRKFFAQGHGEEMRKIDDASFGGEPGTTSLLMIPVLSRRNEVEVQALIAGFVEKSLSEAKEGASNCCGDPLVNRYLIERARVLQAFLTRTAAKFPEIFTGDA